MVLTAAVMALAATACSSGGQQSGAGGGKPYIAIVSKGFQHQFWQAVKQGAEEEAKAQGARITFEGPPTEQDIEQQVTM
ncbi:MAG TPA: BMP family ABC transporter substrate-binding protein, partial [Streptomyces sp.]|nr:BMP family ABC transporter substrate-binding protein [Streptomyces sp.]